MPTRPEATKRGSSEPSSPFVTRDPRCRLQLHVGVVLSRLSGLHRSLAVTTRWLHQFSAATFQVSPQDAGTYMIACLSRTLGSDAAGAATAMLHIGGSSSIQFIIHRLPSRGRDLRTRLWGGAGVHPYYAKHVRRWRRSGERGFVGHGDHFRLEDVIPHS